MIVGINGFNQRGKLQLISLINKKLFDSIVVNVGTNHDKDLASIVNTLKNENLSLVNFEATKEDSSNSFTINGIKVSFVFCDFRPSDINWQSIINIVIETNIYLFDPYNDDIDGNCLRGHYRNQVDLVLVTGPPIQMNSEVPIMLRRNVMSDWCVIVDGVNEVEYCHWNHRIIFIPEPYVICVSKMLLPLFCFFARDQILSVCIFHGENESSINSLFIDRDTNLYNQNLLQLLSLITPDINYAGFIAERTEHANEDEASLTIVVTLHDSSCLGRKKATIDKQLISTLYKQYYMDNGNTRSLFIDSANSTDEETYSFIKIEENKTHTRTKSIRILLEKDNSDVELHQIEMTTAIVHGKYKCAPGLYCDFIADYLESILDELREVS